MTPEHSLQVGVVKMAREIISIPHRFRCFDRSKNASGMQHMHEATRGLRAGTPDTELVVRCNFVGVNVELKKRGTKHLKAYQPSDKQKAEMQNLRDAGAYAECAWSLVEVAEHWHAAGVPLVPHWRAYAEAHDAMAATPAARKARSQGGAMKDKPSARLLAKVGAMRRETMF